MRTIDRCTIHSFIIYGEKKKKEKDILIDTCVELPRCLGGGIERNN